MFLLQLPLLEIAAWIAGFLLALSVHEAAHAWVADVLGDPTARHAGRVTLDPRAHLDPAGTLFLLFVGFGWGRPVPVNSHNFRNKMAGEILTALAGPASNLLLAFLLALPLTLLFSMDSVLVTFLQTALLVNIVLAVFNLIPIFPLDGGNLVAPLLPISWQDAFLRYGPIALFSVIAVDWVFKTSILWSFLGPAIDIVYAVIMLATRFGG